MLPAHTCPHLYRLCCVVTMLVWVQVIHLHLASEFLFLRLVEACQGDSEAQYGLLPLLQSHLAAVVCKVGDAKVGGAKGCANSCLLLNLPLHPPPPPPPPSAPVQCSCPGIRARVGVPWTVMFVLFVPIA